MESMAIVIALASVAAAMAMSALALRRIRESRERSSARVEALRIAALPDDSIFGGGAELSAPARRWLALAVSAATMTLLIGVVYALNDPDLRPEARSVATRAMTPAVEPTRPAAPLVLRSLRHTFDASNALTVSGLIQNQTTDRRLAGVTAVVEAFDDAGRAVATGTSLIDVPALDPGAESTFVVKVKGAASVRRLQVTFRANDGHLLTHLDRRM